MAEEAEDVLELDDEQVIDEQTEGDPPEDDENQEQEDGATDEDEGETYFGFEGEEGAAPVPESESSVIRGLRERNRELNERLKAVEAQKQPEQIEVGEEPTLEGCDYDEDRFKSEWSAYQARKAKADEQERKRQADREAQAKVWQQVETDYAADKASLNIPNFDEAEAEVAAVLPESHRALLLKSGKGAALVAALSQSPKTLEELSKLDPADAAMMIGELRSKVQMKKRARPNVDRPVKGNAASTSADKELERLEKEAERTGNRTPLIAYKRKLRKQA